MKQNKIIGINIELSVSVFIPRKLSLNSGMKKEDMFNSNKWEVRGC